MAQLHHRPVRARSPRFEQNTTPEHYGELLLKFALQKELFLSDSPLGDAIRCVWSCHQLGIDTSYLSTPKDIRLLQRHIYVLQHVAYLGCYSDTNKHALTIKRLSDFLSVSQALCSVSACWLIQHGLATLLGDHDDPAISLSDTGERMAYIMTHPLLPRMN